MKKEGTQSVCAVCGSSFYRPPTGRGPCCSRSCGYKWRKRSVTPLAARLWRKVDTSAGPDACWPWTGGKLQSGYGSISSGPAPNKRLVTSRVAYELTKGPIPDGCDVLHSCDNPPCCNPAHLRVGTPKDNSDDKLLKNREARGESCGKSKLTSVDITLILSLIHI